MRRRAGRSERRQRSRFQRGALAFSALVERGSQRYAAPSCFHDKAGTGRLRWRVVALTSDGEDLGGSAWRDLHERKLTEEADAVRQRALDVMKARHGKATRPQQ